MKKNEKKDELLAKFKSLKIEKNKLEKVCGGMQVITASQDIQTGLTSSGNHDNTQTPTDSYYDGTR